MVELMKIRRGNDISFEWTITTKGEATSLVGRDIRLEMLKPNGSRVVFPYTLNGNVIMFTYYGKDQKLLGRYHMTLWENYGKEEQSVVDTGAVELVPFSGYEDALCGCHSDDEDTIYLGPSDIVLGNVVSIVSVEQVVETKVSEGENIVRFVFSNGKTALLKVRNGKTLELTDLSASDIALLQKPATEAADNLNTLIAANVRCSLSQYKAWKKAGQIDPNKRYLIMNIDEDAESEEV